MAVTAIPVQTFDAYAGKIEDISFTAATTDNHTVAHSGGDILILVNNGSAGSLDVVLVGVASPRTFDMASDITISTGASEISGFVIPDVGFSTSGSVSITVADASSLSLAAFKLTTTPRA